MQAENDSNVKAEHSLGKGEVLSSILSGSTRNPILLGFNGPTFCNCSAVQYRTLREHDATRRGKSVDFVHGSIRENAMSNDNTPPVAPVEMTPNQQKLFNAIGEAIHMIGMPAHETAPVLAWWARWEREQQANVDKQGG